MTHDTDIEKLNALNHLLKEGELEEFTNWEIQFIEGNYKRTQETDVLFTEKQSRSIDTIYEKAWRKGLLEE